MKDHGNNDEAQGNLIPKVRTETLGTPSFNKLTLTVVNFKVNSNPPPK